MYPGAFAPRDTGPGTSSGYEEKQETKARQKARGPPLNLSDRLSSIFIAPDRLTGENINTKGRT